MRERQQRPDPPQGHPGPRAPLPLRLGPQHHVDPAPHRAGPAAGPGPHPPPPGVHALLAHGGDPAVRALRPRVERAVPAGRVLRGRVQHGGVQGGVRRAAGRGDVRRVLHGLQPAAAQVSRKSTRSNSMIIFQHVSHGGTT